MMKLVILAAGLALASASGANAATVINGDFETGTDPNASPNGFITLTAPDSANLPGWTISSGSIDYVGNYWQAQGGSARSVDLAGISLGTLSQSIATVAGQLYEVTFWASKNPDGGDPTRTGTVSFGGGSQTFAYSAINDRSNMNWQQYSFDFTATGPTSLLSFAADASAGCCYGPALDTVSVAAVPEPATWGMMLLGFLGIGAVLRRRRVDTLAQMA